MNKKPLVSVVIPVYNTEKFLSECLSSVYNQSYKNIEVIIINDGSTDGSKLIINRYYKEYKDRTFVLTNKKPSGSGEMASNMGIKISQGNYVAIMDSDDVSCFSRIEKEVDFLEKHKDYFLVSSSAELINEDSTFIGSINVANDYMSIMKKIYLNNSIINSTVMFRKSDIKNDFYKIKYPFFNDYYSWFYYLSLEKKIYTLSDKLVKYRVNSSSSTRKKLKRNFNISFKIKNDILCSKKFKILMSYRLIILTQQIMVFIVPSKLIDLLCVWKIRVFG